MMLTQDAARELVADRLRTLQAAYSPVHRPAEPLHRPLRRKRRFALLRRRSTARGRTSLAAGHG